MRIAIFVLALLFGGRLFLVHPGFLLILCGAIWNAHWSWWLGLVLMFLMYATISSVATTRVAITEAYAAYDGFLAQPGYVLTPIDAKEIVDKSEMGPEFTIGWYQRLKGRPTHPELDINRIEPLLCFLVSDSKGGRAIRCSRAFVNSYGSSFIFLDRHPKELGDIGKFMLFHELGHITLKEGAWQAESLPVQEASNLGLALVMLPLASNVLEVGVIAACYATNVIFNKILAPIDREVIADNAAARRCATSAEKLRVLGAVIALFNDFRSIAGDEFERLTWNMRIKYLEKCCRNIRNNNCCPLIHWADSGAGFLRLLWGGVAVWLGATCADLPLLFFCVGVAICIERNHRALCQWGMLFDTNAAIREKIDAINRSRTFVP